MDGETQRNNKVKDPKEQNPTSNTSNSCRTKKKKKKGKTRRRKLQPRNRSPRLSNRFNQCPHESTQSGSCHCPANPAWHKSCCVPAQFVPRTTGFAIYVVVCPDGWCNTGRPFE
jgi:hypothetical protein